MENQEQIPSNEEIENAFDVLSPRSSSDTVVEEAVATLANASRPYESVRVRLADPEALRALVRIVESSIGHSGPIVDTALRCIGNTCAASSASTAARTTLTELGFTWALKCLQAGNDNTKTLTAFVLYNICNEFEPAQLECYHKGVHFELIRSLDSRPNPLLGAVGQAIDLVLWITGHKSTIEPTLALPLETDLLVSVLNLPRLIVEDDIDCFASLVEVMLTFVRDTTITAQIVQNGLVDRVWETLCKLTQTVNEYWLLESKDDPDLRDVLLPLSHACIWCLSDIAAHSDFAKAYPLNSKLVGELIQRIMNVEVSEADDTEQRKLSGGDELLVAGACQVIGNLLWLLEPATYSYLVEEVRLDSAAFVLVARMREDKSNADVGHSAAGLLIQLSRPSPHIRELMGSRKTSFAALERLLRHELVAFQGLGRKLLSAMGKDCPSNRDRFSELARIPMGPTSGHEESAVIEPGLS